MHNSFEAFLDGFTIEEICIPVETPPWLWQGMKDEDGVIGPHRFRIKYLDSNLERKRTQRLVVEAQEHQNGTNHTGMFTDGSVNGY